MRTVSGIRGQIKKEISKPEGAFRATFEDKIIKSDLVFLRTWVPVDIPNFYNPITTYGDSKMLRTHYQLRRDLGVLLEQNRDSEYKEIKREERVFPNLVISQKMEGNLPFKSKSKNTEEDKDEAHLLKKLNLPNKRPLKKVLSEKEKKLYSLVQRLETLKKTSDKVNKQNKTKFEQEEKKKEEKIELLRRKKKREEAEKKYKKERK